VSVGLILGIVGFVGLSSLLQAGAFTRHWRRNRRFLRFRFREPMDVVISTDQRLETPLTESGRTYPRFVASLGSLQAAAAFAQLIGQAQSRKPVRIQMSEKLTSDLRGDLVLLGGPVLNDVSDMFLKRLNDAYNEIRVVFEDEKADHARISVGTFADSYDCRMQRRHAEYPTDDFALIVAWRNPFARRRRRAIMCAGFTYHGTAAAAKYLISEVIPRGRPLGVEPMRRRGLRHTWPSFVLALKIEFSADRAILVEERAVVQLPEPARLAFRDAPMPQELESITTPDQLTPDSSAGRT
jgi:hypothetical protein